MAINPNNGVLDIVNGVLKVSSIDIKESGGFATAINTVARNDVLLYDDQHTNTTFLPAEGTDYRSTTGVTRDTSSIDFNDGWVYWPLKLPNSWHAQFDMRIIATGGVFTFSLFNTSTPNHTDYTANDGGYKIVFDNTNNQIDVYWEGSVHATASANVRSTDWQHVNINYFRGAVSISLAGKVVLNHGFTENYQEADSRYLGFSATSGTSHEIRNLAIHNSDKWLYTHTSNASDIAYVSGNVGIGSLAPTELLDVHGNVHIAKDLTVDGNLTVTGTTFSVDQTNLSIEDPIIELARGNASDTIDSGLVITRATSNVAVAYRGDESELALGYTQSGASETDVVPVADGGLDVRVYGNLFANNLTTTANVNATYVKGDGSELTQITLDQVVGYGNVTANTIVSTGNIHANYFHGDGSELNNISATLQEITDNSNVTSNTVQFTNSTTALVADSNVGIGTRTPSANLHVVGNQYVNDPPTQSASFDHSDAPLTLTHSTPTSTTAIDDPKAVLHLTRDGTSGESYGAKASFKMSRYENSGAASRSRLDVTLADGTYADTSVMTVRSDGRVGINTTAPDYGLDVHGTANVGALTVTSVSGDGSGLTSLNASNISSGTLNNARLPASINVTNVSGDGSGLASLNASNISTGTLNNARLPASINVTNVSGDGSGLASLNASNISTGTLNNARLPASINVTNVSGNGSGLTALNGDQVTTGTVAAARIDNLDASKITTGTITRPVDTTGTVKAASLYTDDYIYHEGDTNTTIRFPANDTITLNTAGSERVRINSSGNVGIGTVSPLNKLHILHESATQPSYYNSSYDTASLAIINELNYNVEDVATPQNHYTNLLLSSDHAHDSGYNAAGAISFAAPNEFGGYTTQYGRISGVRLDNFYGGLSFATMHNLNNGRLHEDMRIQNGNVGIGTNNPRAPLDINDTGAMIIPVGTTAQQPSTAYAGMVRFDTDANRISFYNGTSWVNIGSVSASGGTETNIGGYKIHTFSSTGNTTFNVYTGGSIEVLLVAGGGGGGGRSGGGGGGGGVVHKTSHAITPGSYTITVGAGGSGGISSGSYGSNGTDTTAFGLTAKGGGGGASDNGGANPGQGNDGGCGGGGRYGGTGGSGTQTSQAGESGTYGHGYDGGGSVYTNYYNGGGGGGAGGVGGTGTTTSIGNGGVGYQADISGTNTYYAGGGGGGSHDPWPGSRGTGGAGGGGNGGINNTSQNGGDGTDGLGGGGGAGSTTSGNGGAGGTGGDGVVIIRYLS